MRNTKKMLINKIVGLKKICKFSIQHFVIGPIIILINIKNIIKYSKIQILFYLFFFFFAKNQRIVKLGTIVDITTGKW